MERPAKNQRLVMEYGDGYKILEPNMSPLDIGPYWHLGGRTYTKDEVMIEIPRRLSGAAAWTDAGPITFVAPNWVRRKLNCEYVHEIPKS